jgi:hypothetical protein
MGDAEPEVLLLYRLEAAEGRADKATAEATAQAAQLQDLFRRYKAFKSSDVAGLGARLRAALSGGSSVHGTTCSATAAGGKENDKTAAALLRSAACRWSS